MINYELKKNHKEQKQKRQKAEKETNCVENIDSFKCFVKFDEFLLCASLLAKYDTTCGVVIPHR